MKHQITNVLAAFTCAAVILGSTTACSNQGASSSSSTSGSSATVKKPTEMTMMVDGFGCVTETTGLKQYVEQMEKDTGIPSIKVTVPNHNEYSQKVKMCFASGEIPDIVGLASTDLVTFANNNALYDMTNMINKSAVYQKILKTQAGKESFDSVKISGKIYNSPLAKGSGVVTYIRKDLLDKAGLKVPTTQDELITALRAFAKMKTSDGKSIIPCTAPGLDPQVSSYLPDFYQQTTGSFEKKNGKWIDGFTTSGMTDTLTKLQSAYKEGLLDKEIVTNKTSTCRDKWDSGQVGVFSYWSGKWSIALSDGVKKSVQGGEVVPLPAIKGTHYYRGTPSGYSITAKCKNPEGVFKYFFEYIEDGKDGTMLFTHGVKDVHYKIDSNGNFQSLPLLNDPNTLVTNTVIEVGLNLQPNFKDPLTVDQRVTNSNSVLSKSETTVPLLPASDAYSKYGGNIQSIKSQIVSKVVIQNMSVSDAINQYKSQTNSMVTQILNEFNKSK